MTSQKKTIEKNKTKAEQIKPCDFEKDFAPVTVEEVEAFILNKIKLEQSKN